MRETTWSGVEGILIDPATHHIELRKKPVVEVPDHCYAIRACAWLHINMGVAGSATAFLVLVPGRCAEAPSENLMRALTAFCLGMPQEYFRCRFSPVGDATTLMLGLRASDNDARTELTRAQLLGVEDISMDIGSRRVLLTGKGVCGNAWTEKGSLHLDGDTRSLQDPYSYT